MGQVPAPQSVRGEALVDQCDRAGERRVPKIRIELRQLLPLEEPLVHDGPARQADDVAAPRVLDRLVQPAPDDVELPLEGRLVPRAPLDEELPDARHDLPRQPPDLLRHHWHLPEAQEPLPLLGDDPLQVNSAIDLVAELEEHPDPVEPGRRKLDAQGLTLTPEEGVRDLGQDARPVSRLRVAPARAPVLKVAQDLQPLLDRLPRPPPVYARHEPEAASIVFVGGIVKTGSGGQRTASYSAAGCKSSPLFTRIIGKSQGGATCCILVSGKASGIWVCVWAAPGLERGPGVRVLRARPAASPLLRGVPRAGA